jgi:imidazole glycerol-phosphate synthase subunit HisH
MTVVIDYKAGNLKSVERALNKLDIQNQVSDNYKDIEKADHIIFPGVGSAMSAMREIFSLQIDTALKDAFNKGVPILGICLGTQIILSHSEEGDVDCLGLINGNVPAFTMKDLKIPHMGWNNVYWKQDHPVFKDIPSELDFYFVHSFYPDPDDETNIYATTDYGITFASAIGLNNLIALQFHPEKSGKIGLQLLDNFVKWDGSL